MLVSRWPLAKTAESLRRGDVSVVQMVSDLCERIDSIEPEVHAYLPEAARRERLLSEAHSLLRRFEEHDPKPPLFGVPSGIKDIFHVDGYVTRAGTALPPHLFWGAEAIAVARLRDAGALITGKTITTEFAFAEPGPTRNPHNPAHTPGGSSSGSAAAVASGMCLVSLGTQTIGSVIRPAAFCGIVGVKPSFDRIPTSGLIYFSRSADHVGFFTQDVAGARLVARVLYDSWSLDLEQHTNRPPVIGIPEGPYLAQASPEAIYLLGQQAAALEIAGMVVKRTRAFDDIEQINRRHRRMVAAEVALEHSPWFDACEHLYRPRTREIIIEGRGVPVAELEAARQGRFDLREQLHHLMDREGLDILASPPAVGTAPAGIGSTGDPLMNLPWTHAGVPVVSVPAGRGADGLPVGIQLAGRFGDDERLLCWAQKIETVLAGTMAL